MALILSRKCGETVQLILDNGKTITVQIQTISGNHVKVRIDAPQEVQIVRDELIEYIDLEAPPLP